MKESLEHIKARMAAALAVIQSAAVACPVCGLEFIRAQIAQRYCSPACARTVVAQQQRKKYLRSTGEMKAHGHVGTHQSEEHKRKRAEATARTLANTSKDCRACGNAFTPTSTTQMYCSGQCWNASKKKRPKLPRVTVVGPEYARMVATYRNRCQICDKEGSEANGRGATGRLAVDHDHTTGVIRGLLCHRCNTALGLLNDSADLAHQAFRYLAYHAAKERSA